jgi:serine phosphatase RsbU (regulator of sigma subunit)
MLLLYTDGLVERRGEGIAVGLDRLRAALAAAPDDAERCAQEIIQTLAAEELADDAALIVLRFLGP